MSSTLMEYVRAGHHEREALINAIAGELKTKPKSHRETMVQQHKLKRALDQAAGSSKRLKALYTDADGTRKDELNSITGPNTMQTFYDRLRDLRDQHRKYPTEPEEPMPLTLPDLGDSFPQTFSGEESFGRYVDLNAFHLRFTNLTNTPMEYSTYLQVVEKFHTVEKEKKGIEHKKYVTDLFDYLRSFYERTHPLADFDEILKASIEAFEEQWAAGTVLGYEEEKASASEKIDLGIYFAPKHLEEVGREALKKDCARLGLKQGGTLQQLAERLFATKGKDLGQLDKKMFSKSVHYKEVALLEMKCARLVEVLREVIEGTRINIQKKQSRSQFENEQEAEDEVDGEEEVEESDEEDKPFYNPLNLPLGWDGKPIPFWLYKLHGLGIEYKCEICGNYSFWGRRAFERHFQEWRHAHGMRCLKIPNTRHFHEITLIEDALSLWEKIKSNAGEFQWRPDAEEEFEDSQGNVLNRKTYDDLARQGLL